MRFREFISESISDRGILKAIFIVGIPGAGKSYTTKKITGAIQPRIVNTDRATEFLSFKNKKSVDSSNWPEFKDKAHHITRTALGNYVNSMLPLIIDGTSNDASNILHRVGILESLGYDVGMVFIDTSLETALKRAAARERKVDPTFIKFVNDQAQENLQFFKTKFSFFEKIKNDEGEMNDDIILAAFKSVQSFYDYTVKKPVGKRLITDMQEQKSKYLSDIMGQDVIDRKIENWYK